MYQSLMKYEEESSSISKKKRTKAARDPKSPSPTDLRLSVDVSTLLGSSKVAHPILPPVAISTSMYGAFHPKPSGPGGAMFIAPSSNPLAARWVAYDVEMFLLKIGHLGTGMTSDVHTVTIPKDGSLRYVLSNDSSSHTGHSISLVYYSSEPVPKPTKIWTVAANKTFII
jgi:hypothetical protein